MKVITFNLGHDVNLEMVLIPSGRFVMGSPESEVNRGSDETQHEVIISNPFYLGKFPITQGHWPEVMGYNPSRFKGDSQLPVETISYVDVQEFCRKLTNITQAPFGMPTEAQWEYACRAGTTTPFHFGSELNGTQSNCNGHYPYPAIKGWFGTKNKGPYHRKTTIVGKYPANSWGLHDMHGNVWEWCSDWYEKYPTGTIKDPFTPENGTFRIRRGGSWHNDAENCRSARRPMNGNTRRNSNCGFRVMLGGDFEC
jgi:formylglycine-generating enzyme required for sulfatase activity